MLHSKLTRLSSFQFGQLLHGQESRTFTRGRWFLIITGRAVPGLFQTKKHSVSKVLHE